MGDLDYQKGTGQKTFIFMGTKTDTGKELAVLRNYFPGVCRNWRECQVEGSRAFQGGYGAC